MLKQLEPEQIKISDYPVDAQPSIAYYLYRVKSGKKLDFKLNVTKKEKFINVYEYDNKRWRYILIDKIKV